MNVSLICHPDTPSSVEAVDVTIEASGEGALWLRYQVDGPIQNIALPDPSSPDRATELWRSTCFELFARSSRRSGYVEFNFAPSTQWAAYQLSDYRDGMSDLGLAASLAIELDASETHFAQEVILTLPCEWTDDSLHIGLSAIIEEKDGTKSYWALKHPSGAPDFHHPDCFALRLPAPDEA